MPKISVDKNPEQEKLTKLGVWQWPIWTKEA